MTRKEYIEFALREYLYDNNAIELCLSNYIADLRLRPQEVTPRKATETLPSFFSQYKFIESKYIEYKSKEEAEVMKWFGELRSNSQEAYFKIIDDLAARKGIVFHATNEYRDIYERLLSNYVPSNEARAQSYFLVLELFRKEEEKL